MPSFRYPTDIYWGANYRDGYREIEAPSVASALAKLPPNKSLAHLQIFAHGKWRFAFPFHDLPFIAAGVDDEGMDFWRVTPSGNHAADETMGHTYAEAVISYICANRSPEMLPKIVEAITRKGAMTGIEIGFFNMISNRIIANQEGDN